HAVLRSFPVSVSALRVSMPDAFAVPSAAPALSSGAMPATMTGGAGAVSTGVAAAVSTGVTTTIPAAVSVATAVATAAAVPAATTTTLGVGDVVSNGQAVLAEFHALGHPGARDGDGQGRPGQPPR
ncbi:MAG: hypothetical protein ABFS30_16960, partial [Pseudomonadota bacterium]